ncbi:MAG: hypothetical protein ACXVLQ_12065 [Bacteriovorax sp.]
MTVEIIKNKILERAVELVVAALIVLFGWSAAQIAPIFIPFLNQIPKNVFIALLLTSILVNGIFGVVIWILASSNKTRFKLKYGIYWDKDKNPHCPNCKIPIGAYAKYQAGWGYYCKPCNKIFKLTDAHGNDINPTQVLKEL